MEYGDEVSVATGCNGTVMATMITITKVTDNNYYNVNSNKQSYLVSKHLLQRGSHEME